MEKTTFDKGIGLLIANFRDLKISSHELKTWRLLLGDLGDHEFLGAVLRICESHREVYPGTNLVALIRDEANVFLNSGQPSPEEAWAEVMGRFNGRPRMISELTEQAVEAVGGWAYIGASQEKDLNLIRAHFYRVYNIYYNRSGRAGMDIQVRELLAHLTKDLPQLSKGGELCKSEPK